MIPAAVWRERQRHRLVKGGTGDTRAHLGDAEEVFLLNEAAATL
jgi:hypothetical protein